MLALTESAAGAIHDNLTYPLPPAAAILPAPIPTGGPPGAAALPLVAELVVPAKFERMVKVTPPDV